MFLIFKTSINFFLFPYILKYLAKVKTLSSIQNPEIKKLRLLFQKTKERKKQNLFVIEGEREIEKALKGGYILESIFIHEAAEHSFEIIISQSKISNIFYYRHQFLSI